MNLFLVTLVHSDWSRRNIIISHFRPNYSYSILYAAVFKNNIDIVRYILERTNSFDFAETRRNADQCIIFHSDNVDMLDLLREHRNKLVFSEHIRRRAHELAIRLGNHEMIDKIGQFFPL